MASPFAELEKALGITSAPVPMPRPQGPTAEEAQSVVSPPLEPPPVAPLPTSPRFPRPRPALPSEVPPVVVPPQAPLAPAPSADLFASLRAALGEGGGQNSGVGPRNFAQGAGPAESAPPVPPSVSPEISRPPGDIPEGGFFSDLGRGIGRGYEYAQAGGRLLRGEMGLSTPEETARNVAFQVSQAEAFQRSRDVIEGAVAWEENEGFWNKAKVLWDHPGFMGSMLGESFGQSGMSVGLGIAGGVAGGGLGGAGGVGLGSALTEYTSSVTSFLRDKKGVDVSDPDQLAAAFGNEEWMGEARVWAAKRGVAVGTFDALTGLLGAKVLRGVASGLGKKTPGLAGVQETRFSRTAGAGAGLGTEAVGGAGGEAAAQLLTEGRIDMSDVMLEGIAEVFGGAPELAVTTLAGRASEAGSAELRTPTEEDFGGFGPEVEQPPRISSFEEAEAEGRNYYGVMGEDGEIAVTDNYDDAEAQVARKGVRNTKLLAFKPQAGNFAIDLVDVYNQAKLRGAEGIFSNATPEQVQRMDSILMEYDRGSTLSDQTIVNKAREDYYTLVREGLAFSDRVTEGRNIVPIKYIGDPKDMEIRFREQDPAGLDVHTTDQEVGISDEESSFLNSADDRYLDNLDVDLKKLKPGVLSPTVEGIENFAKRWGLEELEADLRANGSDAAQVDALLDHLRARGSDSSFIYEGFKAGELVVSPDARYFTAGAHVFAENKAAFRNAVMKMPQGKSKLPGRRMAKSFPTGGTLGQPGTVSVVEMGKTGKSDPAVQEIKAAVALAQELWKKWKIPFDIKVYPYRSSQAKSLSDREAENIRNYLRGGDYLGYYHKGQPTILSTGDGGTIVVNLDLHDRLKQIGNNNFSVYQTTAHELGHAIAAAAVMEMTSETRTKLFSAYRRFLTSTKWADHRLVASAGIGINKGLLRNSDYQFSFEEWFADQIARWASTSRRPVGFVAKVVRPIAKRILEYFKRVAEHDKVNFGRAEPEIENWLASTLKGRIRVEWISSVQKEHNNRSRVKNENAVKEDLGRLAPQTIASVGMKKALEKLGVETLQVQATTAGTPIPPIQGIFGAIDKFNWFYKWFLSLGQVAERNLHILPLQKYRELATLAHIEQSNIMVHAQERLKEWRHLGRAQADAVGRMLFDLTEMNYRTPAEVQKGVVRWPTTAELQQMARQHGVSAAGLQVIRGVNSDFREALQRYVDQLLLQAQGISDPVKRAQAVSDVQKMHRLLMSRPYFPMTRYGEWTLTVRDASGRLEHFETFEAKRPQERTYKKLRQSYPPGSGYTVRMGKLNEESRGLAGIPPQMLDMIGQTLNLSNQQREDLELLKFQLAPAQSFKKRFLRRNEVSGWSEDAQRNYGHYMFHHAKHYSRVKYSGLLREQVAAVKTGRGLRGDDHRKLDDIANFMAHHLEELLNPKADAAALRSAVAVWYLGFVPQSALLNLTQLGFATAPFLSSKFGDLKTFNVMRKVALDVRNFYSRGTLAGSNSAELRALALGMEEGFINESQAAELAALSEGNTVLASVPGQEFKRRWTQVSALSMKMFEQAELYNRSVTFRAAWRLAQENPNAPWLNELQRKHSIQYARLLNMGWSGTDAVAFLAGKDAVLGTQFEYSKYARPRFMQGRKGAIFMFYLFTQNMLFMLWNNKGVLPRYMLTMALLGGMMGLPGLEDAEEIIRAMAARMGKDFNLEREVRNYVIDVLGTNGTDIAMRGIAQTGLGIPQLLDMAGISWMPTVDMSKQIGMGRALPINPAFMIGAPGQNMERQITTALQENAGAAFGVGFNLYQAYADPYTPWHDMKRWERAMPRAARNISKAVRLGREGEERDKMGATVASFDWQDPEQLGELVAIGMGLQPTKLTRAWDRKIAEIEVNNFWDTRKGILLEVLERSIVNKDAEAKQAALDGLRRYNEEAPASKRVSSKSLKEGMTRRLENIQRVSGGLPLRRSELSVSQEMKRLYPNAVEVRQLKKLEKATEPAP